MKFIYDPSVMMHVKFREAVIWCKEFIYCGCPTCADVALLSKCENELQLMMNVVKRHAKKDQVTINPDKI